jgi:hypothetical protein
MSDVEAAVKRFQRTTSIVANQESAWKALEELTKVTPGCTLFTVMKVDMQEGLARRAYSSHPKQYPVSGTKPIHQDRWFEIVHGRQQCFVANTIDEIAKVFPDHELIASLGCGSVLNLPVVIKGDLVATINMLAEAHHYTPERVGAAEAQLHVPARLCWALAALFDRDNKTPD